MVKGKVAMARKKVEIKRIEKENARQVCFSKRRQGLFKKATELSILCGATVGSVVFSPSGRPYSFGYPSIDEVVDRFCNSFLPRGLTLGGANSGAVTDKFHQLNMKCLELQQSLDSENKKKDRLQEAIEKEKGECTMQWLNTSTLELGLVELQEFQKCLEVVDGAVEEKKRQIDIASTSQYQFGQHTSAGSMVFTGPSSSNGFTDGFEVNRSGGRLEDVCGLGNFPNNQNHG